MPGIFADLILVVIGTDLAFVAYVSHVYAYSVAICGVELATSGRCTDGPPHRASGRLHVSAIAD